MLNKIAMKLQIQEDNLYMDPAQFLQQHIAEIVQSHIRHTSYGIFSIMISELWPNLGQTNKTVTCGSANHKENIMP